MSNQIKDAFDKASLIKDIDERNSIILNYERSGFLDRDNAIKKIMELRTSDEDVAIATALNTSKNSIPLIQSTNNQLVRDLAMQRDILQAKLIKKQAEENKEH